MLNLFPHLNQLNDDTRIVALSVAALDESLSNLLGVRSFFALFDLLGVRSF
jgi:hypothetical protein